MTARHPTHYTILGLSPSILDDHLSALPLLKKAYHRALLRHHPDKQRQSSSLSSYSSSSTAAAAAADHAACAAPGSIASSDVYTVDQIAMAFAVLSSPAQRAEYDARLRQSQALGGSAGPKFHTGVENVDLDDLAFDEETERWYRSCRCGNDRGYLFGEDDLIEVEDEGALLVGCQDCSLWLRVHFAVVKDMADPAIKEEIIEKN
ncbi:hypothetical protein E4U43_007000 [Claviceps pusilla]|uniref:Diphthamide biosynthesis protein 4 n=1 Tax=Claviceps pusilla TaxID=123648 RepID=A0A9P7NFK2_9HYPO|nr:hypothetical protein E4U43_007000 [Claviceps pusilla]